MTHKLKTETFSQKVEPSGGVILLPLTPLFSFVTFHLKEEGDGRFVGHLTYSVVTAYHVTSVLSSIVISSLREEGDGHFAGHLLILW